MPDINPEKVCFLITKARVFDVKEGEVDPGESSNPSDEGFRLVLGGFRGDPVGEELRSFIDSLDEDEQVDLVALAWTGRGDFDAAQWKEAVGLARSRRSGSTAEYLLGIPLLGDYLEEGLAAFGLSCEEFDKKHL
jgi:hypothetical protein